MPKGKTNVVGVTLQWRLGKLHDSFRAFVYKDGQFIPISAKIHPTLKQINSYLKQQKLREAQAEQDNHFQALKQRLVQELKGEHGLKEYRARELVDLKTKSFDFEGTLEEFFAHKSDTGVPQTYTAIIRNVWLPFFIGKGCQHPKEFKQWKRPAQNHVKTAKKLESDELYSVHSRNGLTTAFNQYMKFLCEAEHISTGDLFLLSAKISKEAKKRGATSRSRTRKTYSVNDLFEIKKRIDTTYASNLEMRVKAYVLYFGLCVGLRRGNVAGLKAKNLFPDAKVPHFETNDNIVSGWSRGKKGKITLEASTKTTVGQMKLPMIQPDKRTVTEVARFLIEHIPPDSYLFKGHPDGIGKLWRRIAKECGFEYIGPHYWKHSYATNGARNLEKWYKGNVYLLQKCCMHEDFRTTTGYIDDTSESFLEAFEEK